MRHQREITCQFDTVAQNHLQLLELIFELLPLSLKTDWWPWVKSCYKIETLGTFKFYSKRFLRRVNCKYSSVNKFLSWLDGFEMLHHGFGDWKWSSFYNNLQKFELNFEYRGEDEYKNENFVVWVSSFKV